MTFSTSGHMSHVVCSVPPSQHRRTHGCLRLQRLQPCSVSTADMTYLNCCLLVFLFSCRDLVLPFDLHSWTQSCSSTLTLYPDSSFFPGFVWFLIVSTQTLHLLCTPLLSGFWKLLNWRRLWTLSRHSVTYTCIATHISDIFTMCDRRGNISN